MGMHDTIIVYGSQFTCPDGHVQEEFQSQDFDSDLDFIYLFDNRLYRRRRRGGTHGEEHAPAVENGELVVRTTSRYAPYIVTAVKASIYTHCSECKPVLYVKRDSDSAEAVIARTPWVEWNLDIVDGVVTRVTPVQRQTREDVRQEIIEQNVKSGAILSVDVLPDDDRMALRYFRRWERQQKERFF